MYRLFTSLYVLQELATLFCSHAADVRLPVDTLEQCPPHPGCLNFTAPGPHPATRWFFLSHKRDPRDSQFAPRTEEYRPIFTPVYALSAGAILRRAEMCTSAQERSEVVAQL